MQTLGSPPRRGTAAGTGITQGRGPKKSLQKGEFHLSLWFDQVNLHPVWGWVCSFSVAKCWYSVQ